MYVFKKFLWNKFDSLYVAHILMLSIINCYLKTLFCSNFNIFVYGDLGVGKTFFVKGLIRGIGYNKMIKSPTYNIYNIYCCNDLYVYHFDLYRLNNFGDLNVMYFENNFDIKSIYIFEWPKRGFKFDKVPDLFVDIFFLFNKRYIIIKSCSFVSKNILYFLKKLI
ncbi:MAG: tRNA (adenosine(37)-N6)-threonylcarbamoyltransferase complex ATPase subunit type 1 TsaE [Candidatus Azosocius agrarius]|nr:MAG: tRNA (adenosine(37)-N6)-threonylcarbamoyltransferase complex ATPase subunit type 1 TsaE [Gammaproteobacteria bacterium]